MSTAASPPPRRSRSWRTPRSPAEDTATTADVTYYTTRRGGGVIDMASQGWIPLLTCEPPQETIRCDRRAVRITANILRMFAEGPGGSTIRQRPNLAQFGIRLAHPIHV